jgi:hypothetical protein
MTTTHNLCLHTAIRCRECGDTSTLDNGTDEPQLPDEHEHPTLGGRCRGCDRAGQRVVTETAAVEDYDEDIGGTNYGGGPEE